MEPTELVAELDRLRQMIDAVRTALHPDDVHAVTMLAEIAERITVLSVAAERVTDDEVPPPVISAK